MVGVGFDRNTLAIFEGFVGLLRKMRNEFLYMKALCVEYGKGEFLRMEVNK